MIESKLFDKVEKTEFSIKESAHPETKVPIVEQHNDDLYKHQVELDLYVKGLNRDEQAKGPDKVDVEFNIQVEHRSWGIKDINIMLRGTTEFDVEILDLDDNEVDVIPVKLDYSSLDYELEWARGGGFTVQSLEVYLDREGTIESVTAVLLYYSP
jgi:hypothetical protein